MLTIASYHITEQLYESAHSLVYRGYRNADNLPVVLKVLRGEYPPPEELARFKREYQMTRRLDIAGVIEVYGLEPYQNTLVMILEDFGGESLTRLLPERPLTMPEFLRLAIRITDILGRIHQQQIMHKDINPSNIVWNPDTDHLKIIDFGISTTLSREQPDIRNPNVLEGTLAYLSPEQTGRMNRAMDYRTDLYSLGATFYHLLTGQLPFQADDAMEMVYCHLARMPVPPGEIIVNCQLSILSDIILKLLAKNAEDRYQSAFGLKADLQTCLDQLTVTGTIEAFDIGQHDVSDRFQIPQKLYGRAHEIATLLAAFERVSTYSPLEEKHPPESPLEGGLGGVSELILVAGYAGIGKSALVHEIHKPITEKRGYFIAGKFDQFTRNIPYAALIQAFQAFVRQLLTEPEARIAVWKEQLLKALGPNGQVIMAVIPEIELIIGKQPAVPELPPHQEQHRFNFVFQNVVRACATADHPLVIFLDDLQWADLSSLKLIELFMTDPNTQYLLIVGAYRDNEVHDAHPLMLTLNEMQKARATVETITLKPLELEHVNYLLADTLHVHIDGCAPLAKLLFQKTHGNPFFFKQFLLSLYEERLLEFDLHIGMWRGNLEMIRNADITENVVELMAGKIQKLSEETQHVLKLAACIGNQFDLQTLSIVHETSQTDTLHDLWKALQKGLILVISGQLPVISYQLSVISDQLSVISDQLPVISDQLSVISHDVQLNTDDCSLNTDHWILNTDHWILNTEFTFLHDRVQQAAYLLIDEEHKQAVHLKIGRLLLSETSEAEREEKLFEIVNHLNVSRELITTQTEREELAKLNLMAGKKAKAAAAYEAAFKYLQVGVDLIGGAESWQRQYELTLALHVAAAEAAYLSGNFERMEQLARIVLQRARTLLDKVKIYEVRIDACKAQNKLLEAVKIGLPVLKLLGITFPEKPNKFHILRSFLETKFALAGKQIETLSNLPEMTDPDKLAVMRIAPRVVTATNFAAPDLLPLIVCKLVKLSVRHGNVPMSAFIVYAGYGMILCRVIGDIESGYRFGKLALRLLERFNVTEFNARTLLVVNVNIRHWKEHVRETLQPNLKAYQSALETGDLECAAVSAFTYTWHSYFIGKELVSLEREIASYSEVMGQLKQETIRNYQKIIRQAVLNLMRKADPSIATSTRAFSAEPAEASGQDLGQVQDSPPWRLVGEIYDEEHMLPLHLQANDKTALWGVYCHKLLLCYLFQAYPQAVENAALTKPYLDAAPGSFTPLFHFYDSLARLAVFSETSKIEQRRIRKRVAANQKKMKKWAHHAPMNYRHKWYLVEAERARVLGNDAEAMDYYDSAIALAKEHEYIHEEALANELAARFYLTKGKEKIARTYMRDAHYCYLKWGAAAKVQQLEQTYAKLLTKEAKDGHHLESGAHLTLTDTTKTSSGVLDFTTVMKASQTISGEIVLEKLLTRLMAIVIENAGAEYGVLLFEEDGEWIVKAEGGEQTIQTSEISRTSEVSETFPTTIISYVARTKTPVVLRDAAREGQFTRDQYILAHHPRSVLCTPLLNQGKLMGILYLENNLTTGAFTSERLKILKLLSSQAAISIENATLYTTLEQKVEARTAELMRAKEVAEDAQRAAEVANQAKSTFLANISHELRTPLNAILGYTQLLKRDKEVMDRQPDAIETIRRSGEHVVTMIDELLDLSRIEARKVELNPTDVHLPGFLKHLVDMTRLHAQQKGIVFDSDISSHLPAIVQADEQRLRQILLNLLNNAIKFTEKGKVSLRVYELHELHELRELHELHEFKEFEEGYHSPTQKLRNSKTQKLKNS